MIIPVFQVILGLLVSTALITDARRYIIPNWTVLAVILLYFMAFFLLPGRINLLSGIYAGLGCFAVGYLIFILRIMGGGDVKLISALALWTGLETLLDFIFLTAIIGGVLTILLLIIRRIKRSSASLPRLLRKGQPVPYGIAIALAFLTLLITQNLPSLHN